MDLMAWWKQGVPPGTGWQGMCGKISMMDGFDVLLLTALLGSSHIAISLETLISSLSAHFITPGGRSLHVGCSSIVTLTLCS